ncbi:hypothetical protein CPB85DRAFT_1307634 [Mucidula mucida]|nr:hypothetical protein CPB85DRAFT_1307634 [Mucidula mucida]
MAYSPDLPLDVIRLFMEAAAWSDRSIAYNLTLVSRDVHQWINPILYHTITLDTPTTFSAFAVCMVARNDPEFFHRAVKDLTIGKFELEHFPQQGINFDDCMTVILTTCTGVERFSILTATTFRLKWKHMQPKYVFFVVGKDAESFPLLYNLLSPSLTHLHLDFASPDGLSIYKSIVAVSVFKQSPGLSHLQLSGGAFESQTYHPCDIVACMGS